MSVRDRLPVPWPSVELPVARLLALAGLAVALGSSLTVLRTIVGVSGDLSTFYLLAAGALVTATALARVLRVALALAVAVSLLAVGLVLYVLSLPYDPAVGAMVESNLELLAGQSILEIERSTVWGLSVTPAPVFVTWYLGLRGWYGAAAAVGGGLLGYFVLTGDAGVAVTLLGTVGAAAAVGFGDLADQADTSRATEAVAVVLAVMVVTPLLVSVVPSGAAGAVEFGESGTVEASLLSTESRVEIAGSISLSPTVRYTVTSEEARYWRTSSYNRYTGDTWVRSGDALPYDADRLASPPGESRELRQRFRAESRIRTMPAAWRPVSVGPGVRNRTEITADGGLRPTEALEAGDSYRVTSALPTASPQRLAEAGTDDPAELARRYTQLPASTPDRVARRTENVAANARNRYQTVRVIEEWLRTNRGYSLEVDRPSGNVADAFLFEMERGYCTYFATTMVTMLRTQDIPARLAVGYTTGEQVDTDQYVVRGYNSHAWVEVYFPDVGWVQFDPTPAGPRVAAEQARLEEARSGGIANVDTNRTEALNNSETPTPAGPTPTPTGTADIPDRNVTTPFQSTPADGGGGSLPELPPPDQLALALVVLVGAAAGLRRSGLAERAYRWLWLRHAPRVDPATDIERAFRQVEYILARRHRPRRPGETVRAYLDAIDADRRARRVARLRERARYGDGATEDMAEEALELARSLRRQDRSRPSSGGPDSV